MRRSIIVLLSIFLGLAIAVAQEPTLKCPSYDIDPTAPKYQIGRAAHAKTESCALYIYISIDATHFVRDDMVKLAKRLNQDFCFEKKLTAIILDDSYAARHPLRNTKSYWDAERGSYHLDRLGGEENIKFSTSRGKPSDEITIDLRPGNK